eukprot:TRINITY_DN65164_c0_g1_i1.p1 TRINITY_DN65164_c0_g1~~TRINITY_DN65164_c0_g1_i1.p1  ORF type:complete len:490 (-),score=93.57 TRINITY_DN65164_c0_g1_i1:141-1610(-)
MVCPVMSESAAVAQLNALACDDVQNDGNAFCTEGCADPSMNASSCAMADDGSFSDEEHRPVLVRSNTITWYNEDVLLEWPERAPPPSPSAGYNSDWAVAAEVVHDVAHHSAVGAIAHEACASGWSSADEAPGDDHLLDRIGLAQRQAEMRAWQEDASGSWRSGGRRRRGGRSSGGRSGHTSPPLRMNAAELMANLEADEDSKANAVASMRGSVSRLSLESAGCRAVQLALEVCELHVAADLASELRGRVREAVESPHGNYVIQKIIEALPPAHAGFVAEELRGVAARVARHRYGCRILCRLLEHSSAEPSTALLVDEALEENADLCRHNFGHHVIECVLEHGQPAQRHKVCADLCESIRSYAQHRTAVLVLEKALVHCGTEERRRLLEGLGGIPIRGRAGTQVVPAQRSGGADGHRRMRGSERGLEGRAEANAGRFEAALAWPAIASGRRPGASSGKAFGGIVARKVRRPLEGSELLGAPPAAPTTSAW